MIKASFDEAQGRLSLSVDGHAGAAVSGKDIVCASASILFYTAARLVKEYELKDMLEVKANISIKNGRGAVTLRPKEMYYEEVRHTFSVVQAGFMLLQENFPQYVAVKSFGKA